MSELLSGDVFEYKDDMYMLVEKMRDEYPRERRCIDLSNGKVFIFSINAQVIPLKAKMIVEFENYED